MNIRSTILVGAALGALTCPGMAQTAPAGQPARPEQPVAARAEAAQPGGIARASNLIGTRIVDEHDKVVGEIKDILACGPASLVVLIERDADDKLVGAPLSALTARLAAKADRARDDTNGDGVVVTDTAKVDQFMYSSAKSLATAPVVMDRARIDQAWWTAFGEHYALKPLGKSAAAHPDTTGLAALIGQDVKSATGEVVGDVEDVAVDLADGTVAYVVISTGGVAGVGSALHGVRLDALKPDAERKFVTLLADKATLERMTGIDLDRLPARASFEVGAVAPVSADRGEKGRSTPR